MDTIIQLLAEEFHKNITHVQNVVTLIDEGNTIPFIARYRKEMHGTMDDQTLRKLADRLIYLRNLDARRTEVKNAIEAQEKLTDELAEAIDQAKTLAEVESLYLPYKQKRRTRATIAREKGLEPLASFLTQTGSKGNPIEEAAKYIDPEKSVTTFEEALAGAKDIIAEDISLNIDVRKGLQELYQKHSFLTSRAAKEEDSVYALYYEFSIPACKAHGHQILAINRGEKEGFLKVSITVEQTRALTMISSMVSPPNNSTKFYVQEAIEDSYNRLLHPSLEREIRNELTDAASEGAIHMFALNLKPTLMQPPVKGSVTMGLDPGYRNGCKVAVVDATGKVLDTAVVYPTFSDAKKQEAIAILKKFILKDHVKHIAIGNGTASRETEQMTAELLKQVEGVSYMIVNEAGASVYSASPLAAEEFPEYDVNLRSAVSIARRLQDPLAELVKIDSKSIGVGQYQHDMPQVRLDESLSEVVEDCVNAVGVDLNTASVPLLLRVSGLTNITAKNIVEYRNENGMFSTRRELLKVKKLGKKSYEQCAGFLRIPESNLVLDNTSVHPESYAAAEKLLTLCGYTMEDVSTGNLQQLPQKLKDLGEENAAAACEVGLPTLHDIVTELLKPGRDIRDTLQKPILHTDVMEMKDLKPGMELTGTVRNVIDFGAFVDIGVHQDGLVHISQITNRFIRHPSEVLSVGDIVTVWVMEVKEAKHRISLTMKPPAKS